MKRVLAIVGDYYHEEAVFREALNHAVQGIKDEGNATKVEFISVDQLVNKLHERPDAVILSNNESATLCKILFILYKVLKPI